jgi:hypothetical protein
LQIVPRINQLFSLIAHSLSCIGQWCSGGRGVFDMAIAGLGNGGVSTTKIEALAGELRLLKCGMADMQGRLDALLIEIGAEAQAAQIESEPVAAVHEAIDSEATFATETDLFSLSLDVTAPIAEPMVEAVEAAQTDAVEPVEIDHAAAVLEVAIIEPAQAEIVDAAAPAEPIAETPAVVDAIPTVSSTEPVTPVEVSAAEHSDTPAAELPSQNVVLLAEHRVQAGKPRGVFARTMRWAAAIVLIATVAAVAAAGTGFAGNGELLIKSVCATAGEGCSTVLGTP